eukprot:gene193-3580_t
MEPMLPEELNVLDAHIESEIDQCCYFMPMSVRWRTASVVQRAIKAFMWIADNFMYWIGWVLVPMAWILIGTVVVAWYMYLAPYIQEDTGSIQFTVHVIIAHWLLMNIIFNYLMVTITSPGQPPKAHYLNTENAPSDESNLFFACSKFPQYHLPFRLDIVFSLMCIANGSSLPMGQQLCRVSKSPIFLFVYGVFMAGLSLRSQHLLGTLFFAPQAVSSSVVYCFVLAAAVAIALDQTTIEYYAIQHRRNASLLAEVCAAVSNSSPTMEGFLGALKTA